MPKELVVLLLLLLVGYWVRRGLKYESFSTVRPPEYFIRGEVTMNQTTNKSDGDDSVNPDR